MLDQYTRRDHAADRDDAHGAYRALQQGTVLMLDLVYRNGDRDGLPYSYINRVRYRREQGITLHTPDGEVKITGRSLEPLYKAILAHTASAVVESASAIASEDGAVFVERVVWGGSENTRHRS